MRSCFVQSLALIVATVALAPPLHAQNGPRLQLYSGVGLNMIALKDGSRFTPELTLQFGVVRQVAGSRVGARLDATYSQVDRRYAGFAGSSTALGASASLMYDLGTRAWRPYVLGGVGMYELSGADGGRRSTGALIGGLGLRRAIGRVPVFMELRYHYMTNGHDFGPHRLFLTLGIRF